MKNINYCLLVLLCLCVNAYAVPTANIKPLKIGDTVPGAVWQLLGTNTGSGKAVLLDFWELSCGNCLAALPKLDSMQRQFAGKLTVITITSKGNFERINSVLKKYPRTRNVALPIVTGDSLLRRYFPFELVSHLVWIDSNSVVRAITGTDYISAANIGALLAAKSLDWAVKDDIAHFDYEAALMAFAGEDVSTPSPLYYSGICGRLEGIDSRSSTVSDTNAGVTRLYFFNMTLLQLCRLAIENASAGIAAKQLVLQVPDKSRYLPPKNGWLSDWKQQNTYCYFLQIPLTNDPAMQRKKVRENLAQQLKTVFGVSMRKETKLLPCLVLQQSGGTKKKIAPAAVKQLSYNNLSELATTINEIEGWPWLLNESGIHPLTEFPIAVPSSCLTSLASLNTALAPYGLVMTSETRLQELYTVTEENYSAN